VSKRTNQEIETAKRRNKDLNANNATLSAALAEARALVEQGAVMLVELGRELEATKVALVDARAELVDVRAECTAAIAEASAAVAAAEDREQVHKRRLAVASKVAARLWKALAMLEPRDAEGELLKLTPADFPKCRTAALQFRDIHVRKGEHELELLTD
jgi:hypothetical protein